MNNFQSEITLIQHILERSLIVDYIHEELLKFFQVTEITKWLTPSQAAMIGEILSSNSETEITERLNEYKTRQINRKSRWSQQIDGKSIIDTFIALPKDLSENEYLKRIIAGEFGELKLPYSHAAHGLEIYRLVRTKFVDLFMLIYREQREVQHV